MAGGFGGGFHGGAAASTAVASGGITEAGVELAGMAGGAVMAGTEAGVGTAGVAGVTQAGDAAGVGVIRLGLGSWRRLWLGLGFLLGGLPVCVWLSLLLLPLLSVLPIHGPDAYAPADPDRYSGGNRDPRDNSQQQNSRYLGPERSTGVNDKMPTMAFVKHKTADDAGSANYWLTNYQQRTVPRQQVRNVIQALLAMPPEARRRQIESGRYRNFSPEEQELLNQVAHVSPREPQKNVERNEASTVAAYLAIGSVIQRRAESSRHFMPRRSLPD